MSDGGAGVVGGNGTGIKVDYHGLRRRVDHRTLGAREPPNQQIRR